MSGDSVMSLNSQLSYGVEKVGRTENYLFGFAGRLSYMRPAYKWVQDLDLSGTNPEDFYYNRDKLQISSGEDSGNVLLATRDDVIWMVSLDGYAVRVTKKFDSIGSGGDYALGAMMNGASAEESVKCSCGIDAYTGGDILNWTFDKPVHCPNE